MLSKDEKRNIVIAAALSVAAVIILYLYRGGQKVVYTQNPSLQPVGDSTGSANPAALPGYMSYNVPPYDPGNIPPITTYVGGSPIINAQDQSTGGNGKGCCPGCAGDNSGSITSNIGSFLGLMGLGSYGGADINWPPPNNPSGFEFAEAIG